MPLATALSCTSGRCSSGSASGITPTLPPLPSVPAFVLPMLTVCVVASSRVALLERVGSAVASVICATPATSCAVGIMKMLVSAPLGSAVVAPSMRPLPACASPPSSPSEFALRMNWRSVPWQGKLVLPLPPGAQLAASRVLVIAEKLKPKSAPSTIDAFVSGSKVAIDCAVCVAVVNEPRVAELVLEAASTRVGFSPPTRFVTGSAVSPEPVVRKVCTATQVVHAAPPARSERSVPLTTRTVRAVLPV